MSGNFRNKTVIYLSYMKSCMCTFARRPRGHAQIGSATYTSLALYRETSGRNI